MISVRRARVLPPPSFRFRFTTDTLGFGCDLPAAGWSWDFHPLERALAGRTKKRPGQRVRLYGPEAMLKWEMRNEKWEMRNEKLRGTNLKLEMGNEKLGV